MPGSGAAELDAAGITDPALRAAYATCRALNAAHGRTYFLATRLLPAARRPAVHALYGFARYADEIVDDLDDDRPVAAKAVQLDGLTADMEAAFDGAPAAHPVLAALADTVRRYDIDRRHFADFMVSMRMDTTVTEYATFDDLAVYVHGSAAVIGLQMLPILGTRVPREEAEPPAAALGVAFQLTNFLRDVGEDLDRGRVYLPADELAAFGVDRACCAGAGAPGGPIRACAARWPTWSPAPAAPTGARDRASTCWSRCRGPASAARSRCTRASSTRSSGPTTTCCTAASRCRTGDARRSRSPAWPGRWRPGHAPRTPSPGRAA